MIFQDLQKGAVHVALSIVPPLKSAAAAGGIWERSNDGMLLFMKVKERRNSQQWASNHKNAAWDSLESYLHYWRKIHKCLRLMY